MFRTEALGSVRLCSEQIGCSSSTVYSAGSWGIRVMWKFPYDDMSYFPRYNTYSGSLDGIIEIKLTL